MQNLLTFPTGLLTIFLILIALWALAEIAEWLWPDEPVDEIRQGRMSEFAKEQWLKGLHLEGLPTDKIQQGKERES